MGEELTQEQMNEIDVRVAEALDLRYEKRQCGIVIHAPMDNDDLPFYEMGPFHPAQYWGWSRIILDALPRHVEVCFGHQGKLDYVTIKDYRHGPVGEAYAPTRAMALALAVIEWRSRGGRLDRRDAGQVEAAEVAE